MSHPAGPDVHAELVAVAEQHGTPAYVYRPDVLAADVARLRAAAAGFDHELRLAFALTSHHLPVVVDDLRCAGLGADVGTADEYDLAVGARFCADRIVVDAARVSEGLLARAVADGAFLILGTPAEVDAAERSCAGRGAALPVGLRVTSPVGSSSAREMVRRLTGSAALELRGLHVALGPELLGSESALDALTPVLHLAATLRDVVPLDRVCVGGGDAPGSPGLAAPDLSSWFARLNKEWSCRGLADVALVVEPGLPLASRCVQVLGRVVSVELLQPRPLVTLDTGVEVLSMPAPGRPLGIEFVRACDAGGADGANGSNGPPGAVMSALVVGPRRDESDVLRYDCPVPVDVSPGDLVLIHDAGRHAGSAAPGASCRTPPVVRLCAGALTSDDVRG